MRLVQVDVNQHEKSNIKLLINSSIIGVSRGLIGLPFQHPFDNIKTNMQAYQLNFKNTFNKIYQKKGFLGFYSGFLINSLRIASKQVYRWPLQIGLFGFYNNLFQSRINRGSLGILCGISISFFQVLIICPFQRLKVWLMTGNNKQKMRQFFKLQKVKALFDGMLPVLLKQTISWVTYLGATEKFKDIAYKYSNKNRFQQQLNTIEVVCVSSAVAIVNTLFVMPVDCVKTIFQKNQQKQLNKVKGIKKFRNTVKQIYEINGWKGFYKGWQVKLIQYCINSLFTVVIFQKLQKQYQKNTQF